MAMERGNGRRYLGEFNCCASFSNGYADCRWPAPLRRKCLGNRARGLLAIWREEEIAYVAGFLLKDVRNLKGKVDVFCFVYRASTATSML